MTIVKFPPKQPYDIQPYQLNFRPHMARGQRINGFGAAVYIAGQDPEEDGVIDATLLYSTAYGNYHAEAKVQGGADGVTYRIRFRVTTVDGSRYEAEGEYEVIEVK